MEPLPPRLATMRPSLHQVLLLREDTAQPLYQQLEEQFAELIAAGTLPPGATLPAERQLAALLGISRATVQRCYAALRQRRLLSAHGRLGSIVQPGEGGRLHPAMDRLKGFTEEMQELGRSASSQIVERAVVHDRTIAGIFGLPEQATLLKLARIRSGDGIPMSHEVAWYNLQLAPQLAVAALDRSVYAVLEALGRPLVRGEQTIEAASPTPAECAIFGFGEPKPCLLIKRRSYGTDGALLEYVEGLFRGDAYAYRLNLRA